MESLSGSLPGRVGYGSIPMDSGASSMDEPSLISSSLLGANRRLDTVSVGKDKARKAGKNEWILSIVYAIVNCIIAIPGLYGYAAIIFNNEVFRPHMNALSKLVLFSSFVHQLGFFLFSSLPFAIGMVQDAGLIFLSSMANKIANTLQSQGESDEAIISTTIVLLSMGTAALGVVLIVMGTFKLADAVAYLPMPVVGGYLAFIGYFCFMAGVGLCISQTMMDLGDWAHLSDPKNMLLAFPGLVAAGALTYASRHEHSSILLPVCMVTLPAIFYVVIYCIPGAGGLNKARAGGWVAEVAAPTPVTDLLTLVDFSLVHWSLIPDLLSTWIGMVFVVSFASCLDVAAIAMDMGSALDTNAELATVGVANLMSGLCFGYTGSYIFSQTIFMYRTGVHSKLVGLFLMIIYLCVVMSPVNILQVVPLFFLGATLIFIGYDLMLEWLFEVRGKIFLSEYLIVWATFISIQIIGIDFGILLGVLVAVVESVVRSAHNISVTAVVKQSRAVWTPTDYKLLQEHGYNPLNPKILSLEIQGTVFFGSSLFVLEQIMLEMGIDRSQDDTEPVSTPFSPLRTPGRTNRRPSKVIAKKPLFPPKRKPPLFLVLDLSQVSNMEATGARGCFLQLAKSCARRGIIVCACGATPRIDWILRAHDVAYDVEEEEKIKALVYSAAQTSTRLGGAYDVDKSSLLGNKGEVERVLLFLTIHEALEFCEHVLIREVSAVGHPITESKSLSRLDSVLKGEETTLANVISHVLGLYGEDCEKLEPLLSCGNRYYSEELYRPGDIIFTKNDQSDAIYVVLEGAVAVIKNAKIGSGRSKKTSSNILSGSGLHKHRGAKSHLLSDSIHSGTNENLVVASMWGVGGIFGYSDCLLSRPYTFNAVCSQEKTRIAKITRAQLKMLREEKPQCEALVKDTVLQASLLDLANCTCDETYAR